MVLYDVSDRSTSPSRAPDAVVQLLDWPGTLKPTLRIAVEGRPISEARADAAPLLSDLQRDTAAVPALQTCLEGTSLEYLDPSRKHYLLWAENRSGESSGAYRLERGASWLTGVLRSNAAWVSPRLPAGTYLIWLVWPSAAPRPHWEMSTIDGTRRWMLPASPHAAVEPAQPTAGGLPDGATLAIARSRTGNEAGRFAFNFVFRAGPSPGIQGGGTMSLAAP
jgi:hypothetical protein